MSNPYASTDSNPPADDGEVQQAVRGCQIITFALLQGTLVFGVIAAFIGGGDFSGQPTILTWMGVGFAGLMAVNHILVPRLMTAAAFRNAAATDEQGRRDAALGAYRVQLIVAMALLESAAFFCLIAYIIDKSIYAFAAAAALLVLMAVRFPTASSMQFWVENRIREMDLS
jgi:hypothetical protein